MYPRWRFKCVLFRLFRLMIRNIKKQTNSTNPVLYYFEDCCRYGNLNSRASMCGHIPSYCFHYTYSVLVNRDQVVTNKKITYLLVIQQICCCCSICVSVTTYAHLPYSVIIRNSSRNVLWCIFFQVQCIICIVFYFPQVTERFMMYNRSHNFVTAVIDEIALEGLDGITLKGTIIYFSKSFTCHLIVFVNLVNTVFMS